MRIEPLLFDLLLLAVETKGDIEDIAVYNAM